jgi:multimeric flavodoxin WrbA
LKVVTILGSPRKKGNTARILGWAEEELHAKGCEIDRINIADHKVNGCKGCFTCKRFPGQPGCPQKDDAVALFGRMMSADALIYATPLYCWDFPSQMKALIDRHVCLVTGYATPAHKSLLEGKKTALLVTCEDQIENNADLIQTLFDRLNEFMKTKVISKLVTPFCTTPDALSDEARNAAIKLAAGIAR